MNVQYIRSGDYFIPDLKLPEETRPIGKWGRMHRDYLKERHPIQFNNLVLSGNLWTYLADLNEQARQRMETLIAQLKSSEGITESLKAADPLGWTQCMNNITARAEEIIRKELIYSVVILSRVNMARSSCRLLCCAVLIAYWHRPKQRFWKQTRCSPSATSVLSLSA